MVFMAVAFISGILIKINVFNNSNRNIKTHKYTIPLNNFTVNTPLPFYKSIVNTPLTGNGGADNKTENTNNANNNAGTNNGSNQGTKDKSASSNHKEFFKNDVFMGDSVTEGLSFYGYLDESRVYSKVGISITMAKNQIDSIVKLNPTNIFLLFGINDMGSAMSSQWFVAQYKELIHYIKSKLPDSKIYIQSILPVMPFVEVRAPYIKNSHITECNEGLKSMAKQENVNFINIASILNDSNKYLFESDGIHFKSDFYGLWLDYLRGQV